MNSEEFNGLKNLVSGIKGTENTLKHLENEGEKIKQYAIDALNDYIDTCEKMRKIVLDSGLYGKKSLGQSYCIIEKDNNGIVRNRTSWYNGCDIKFEFDLLYGTTYGENVYYKVGSKTYIDEYESAKLKIEYIKSHKWSAEGYSIMKKNADLLTLRIKYNVSDIKKILEDILKENVNIISKVSEYSGATYEKVNWV